MERTIESSKDYAELVSPTRPTASLLAGWTDQAVLQALYDSEINCRLSWFWDGGIDWELGDKLNGIKAQGCAGSVQEAIEHLAGAAFEHYPNSQFCRRVKLGIWQK